MTTIGVLALQGAFFEHIQMLEKCAAPPVTREVRTAGDLQGCDGLIIPGGESTTISKLLTSFDLAASIADFINSGKPVFGTCAGMILLANKIQDGRADQICFDAIDINVRRNGYGRQIDSFETNLAVSAIQGLPLPAVFIRAPVIAKHGVNVEVLAAHRYGEEDIPVLCRQDSILVSSFHPELTADVRLHEYFLAMV